MKFSRNWLIEQLAQGQSVKYLFFWGHQPTKDGSINKSCFSQWFEAYPFSENGIEYATAEHYMMAGKAVLFKDQEMQQQIVQAKSPGEAKKLGRKVRGFDQELWSQNKCKIVIQANLLKFSQHEELKQFLLGTKDRILVEASPRDRIWGIGMGQHNENAEQPEKWRGENLLGFCLLEVREKISQ